MALALLIAIWGVFLGVTLVRKRAEYKADSSIGAFQRQLQVLRRNSQAIDRSAGTGVPVRGARPPPDRAARRRVVSGAHTDAARGRRED